MKRNTLPGLSGSSIYAVLMMFLRGIYNGALDTRASSMSFKFFIALFPGIIFLFTLIPFIPIDGFDQELFNLLKEILPQEAYEISINTIEDIILNKNGSVLSFNFLFALYFATNGVKALVQEFNNSLHIENQRGVISQQIISFILVFILLVVLIVSITAIVISSWTIDYLSSIKYFDEFDLYGLLEIGTWLILFLLFFFAISFIFYFGPSKNDKWQFFSPGTFIASCLTIITSLAFSYYVNNFAQYNKLYGSIGTLVVILLWLYLNSWSLLLGFEINASIRTAKKKTKSID